MICKGCQSALNITPSIAPRTTILNTSAQRIQLGAKNERCFICTTIHNAILNPESGFHPISILPGLARDKKTPRLQNIVLGFSAGVVSRPGSYGVLVQWRFPFTEAHHWWDAELKFFFSPISKDQPEDRSFRFRLDDTDESGRWTWTKPRLTRNRYCPHCQAENLPDKAFWQDLKEETIVEQAVGKRVPMREDHKSASRDGFYFDLEVDDAVASNSTGSDQSWSQIFVWLNTCHRSHASCPKPIGGDVSGPTEYPTRLLDLSLSQDLEGPLRLVLSKDVSPMGHYITLSHCWGLQPVISLTSANLKSFRERIDFEELSKTFKDAVIVTHKLGIQYLWIDSLCIIQEGEGSKDDWHRESATMGQVYHNAFLNIGATGAADDTDGCFYKRDYLEVFRPSIFKPECKTHCDYYQKYRLIEESFIDEWLLNEPLMKRGWVYQERFLAPRMLHFGSRQLFWECKETRACESFPTYLLSPICLTRLSELEDKTRADAEQGIIKQVGLYRWYNIVREYTSKELTRGADKLVAISGVAQQFRDLVLKDDEYWAGIWRSDVPGGLCWSVKNGAGRRLETFRAPSWSWASIDGIIEAPRWQRVTDRFLVKLCVPEFDYVMESNPFGAIRSARLDLKTRLVTVQAVKNAEGKYVLYANGTEIERSLWYPDEPSELEVTVTCLCFATGLDGMIGITVSRVDDEASGGDEADEDEADEDEDEDDKYVRTGTFQILPISEENAELCCPAPPFQDLWDMDPEEADWIQLV